MDKIQSLKEKKKKFWISSTGYRALIILKALINKPCSLDELTELLKANNITNKSLSKDTLRITLNTLKQAGCLIKRPNKNNGYKYEIISHPFGLFITDFELNALILLRDKLAEDSPWQYIIKINSFFNKFIDLTKNPIQIETIHNTQPLGNIDENIMNEFFNTKYQGKKIGIIYNSSKNGEENLDILPFKIIYENKRIYLWCYLFKYHTNTMLNLSNIIKVTYVNIAEKYDFNNSYDVFYKVTNIPLIDFELKDYEEITESNENSFVVKANVTNEFWFIQRILQLGSNFKIISPDFFRQKLINKIKLIQKRYENNAQTR